jgi:hypothetical protein
MDAETFIVKTAQGLDLPVHVKDELSIRNRRSIASTYEVLMPDGSVRTFIVTMDGGIVEAFLSALRTAARNRVDEEVREWKVP